MNNLVLIHNSDVVASISNRPILSLSDANVTPNAWELSGQNMKN